MPPSVADATFNATSNWSSSSLQDILEALVLNTCSFLCTGVRGCAVKSCYKFLCLEDLKLFPQRLLNPAFIKPCLLKHCDDDGSAGNQRLEAEEDEEDFFSSTPVYILFCFVFLVY
jgi:hypothetical protein